MKYEKLQNLKAKIKAYYSGVALIALLSAPSISQAMEQKENTENPSTPRIQKEQDIRPPANVKNSQQIYLDDIESIITAANEGQAKLQEQVASLFYQDLFTDKIKVTAKIIEWEDLYTLAMTKHDFANLVIGTTKFQDFDTDQGRGFRDYMMEISNKNSDEGYYLRGRMHEEGWGYQKDPSSALQCYLKTSENLPISRYRYANILKGEHNESAISRSVIHGRMLKNYKIAAEKGYTAAQYKLALIYENGENSVPKDPTEALTWYKMAAAQGNRDAIKRIVELYHAGPGLDCTVEEWEQMAKKGGADVHNVLGKMYENRKNCTSEDSTKAIASYKKAAMQGHEGALKRIVEMYTKAPTTLECTVKEWEQMAEKGGADVHYIIGKNYENGVEPSHAKALTWYKKAVEAGNKDAIQRLVEMYHAKQTLDYTVAEWERMATNGGSTIHYIIGKNYENGENGIPKDPAKALEWYEKAAENKNKDAQYKFWSLHKEKPTESALKHLRNAAAQDHPDAQTDLGVLYLTGQYIGVGKDHTQARNYFMKAMKQNHPEGTHHLAWRLYLKEGGERDLTEAYILAKRAAETLGYYKSYELLSIIYQEWDLKPEAGEARRKYLFWLSK